MVWGLGQPELTKNLMGSSPYDDYTWYTKRHGKFPVLNEFAEDVKTKLQNGANHVLGYLSTPYIETDTDNTIPQLPENIRLALNSLGLNDPKAKKNAKLVKKAFPSLPDVSNAIGAYSTYDNLVKPFIDFNNAGRTEANRVKRAERKRDDEVLKWQKWFDKQILDKQAKSYEARGKELDKPIKLLNKELDKRRKHLQEDLKKLRKEKWTPEVQKEIDSLTNMLQNLRWDKERANSESAKKLYEGAMRLEKMEMEKDAPETIKSLKAKRDAYIKKHSNKPIPPNLKRYADLSEAMLNAGAKYWLFPKMRKWQNSERNKKVVPFIIWGRSRPASQEEIDRALHIKRKKNRDEDDDDDYDGKEDDAVDRMMKQLKNQFGESKKE